mmetsp:Transcript_17604/g.56929  ORF Transcript_17604/g.56929 Transcript_17604/m.56929 type:complete len:176 (-) Transcript_17604:235-762(-)
MDAVTPAAIGSSEGGARPPDSSSRWRAAKKVVATNSLSTSPLDVISVLGEDYLDGPRRWALRRLGTITTLFAFSCEIYWILVYAVKLYDNIGDDAATNFVSTWLFFLLLKTAFLDWFPAIQRAVKNEILKVFLAAVNLRANPYLWFERFEDDAIGQSGTEDEGGMDVDLDDGGAD